MIKKEILQRLTSKGFHLLGIGMLSGLVVGIVVTFYAMAVEIVTERSQSIFEAIRQRPAFVPLLFFVLVIGAFMVGVLTYLLPMLRSNGVPQTEGVSRGLLRMKWYQMLPAMAAASIISVFMGLTAGGEGPSMFIGGMCGDGVSRLFKASDMERRYQITGGACAGVAVAANAPLTGIVFAFEEAHRRFTPSIFVCAFSSVITALTTRNLLYKLLGLAVTSTFTSFKIVQLPISAYLYVALAAILSGVLGVALVKLAMQTKKLFKKFTALRGILRPLIPFLFAGAIGLITVYATGGGHSLIQSLGTEGGARSIDLNALFNSPIAVTLLLILLFRFLALCLNIGADIPCDIFVPIIALGALVGALTSRLCVAIGMDKAYADALVLIAMATVFSATVKAPMTAIIMVVEFTWQISLLLPVVLGVFIGFLISELCNNKPLYDLLLEDMLETCGRDSIHHEYVTDVVQGAAAAGQAIRDLLWPSDLVIHSIERDGKKIAPSSDTVLLAGDRLTLQADTDNIEEFEKTVEEIVKPHAHISSRLFKKASPPSFEDELADEDAEETECLFEETGIDISEETSEVTPDELDSSLPNAKHNSPENKNDAAPSSQSNDSPDGNAPANDDSNESNDADVGYIDARDDSSTTANDIDVTNAKGGNETDVRVDSETNAIGGDETDVSGGETNVREESKVDAPKQGGSHSEEQE